MFYIYIYIKAIYGHNVLGPYAILSLIFYISLFIFSFTFLNSGLWHHEVNLFGVLKQEHETRCNTTCVNTKILYTFPFIRTRLTHCNDYYMGIGISITKNTLRTRLVHCNDYYIGIGISITMNTLSWNVISITIY